MLQHTELCFYKEASETDIQTFLTNWELRKGVVRPLEDYKSNLIRDFFTDLLSH